MGDQSSRHPLDDEDVTVFVCFQHNPTRTRGYGTVMAPPDAFPSVPEALQSAADQALDDLLARLEVRGG